jgi:hypothetical protein
MEDDGLPSHEEFLIDFDDLEFGKKIGRGQYGHVYKGEYLVRWPLFTFIPGLFIPSSLLGRQASS